MAAKMPAAKHPVQATHLGVSKSKAESATSAQPTASATCIATLDPLPNKTWVNTATGSDNTRTKDPRKPRGDRMPEAPDVSCRAATLGVVPTPPASTLRRCSVILRTSSLLPFSGRSCSTYGTLRHPEKQHASRITGLDYRVFEPCPVAPPGRGTWSMISQVAGRTGRTRARQLAGHQKRTPKCAVPSCAELTAEGNTALRGGRVLRRSEQPRCASATPACGRSSPGAN